MLLIAKTIFLLFSYLAFMTTDELEKEKKVKGRKIFVITTFKEKVTERPKHEDAAILR